ncbi:hypothetical protein EVAR_74063_1 [Eumeta japonica]|uniref:Uncharacterized protein n=1 Tax=Eumeta variegata TaxID=151549 RepID=A0A4C1TCB0_EUMVA|nr:hypothetical protein EVAR_74063_1 [Eumeta japonica]
MYQQRSTHIKIRSTHHKSGTTLTSKQYTVQRYETSTVKCNSARPRGGVEEQMKQHRLKNVPLIDNTQDILLPLPA